jgi:hypothetical protein
LAQSFLSRAMLVSVPSLELPSLEDELELDFDFDFDFDFDVEVEVDESVLPESEGELELALLLVSACGCAVFAGGGLLSAQATDTPPRTRMIKMCRMVTLGFERWNDRSNLLSEGCAEI